MCWASPRRPLPTGLALRLLAMLRPSCLVVALRERGGAAPSPVDRRGQVLGRSECERSDGILPGRTVQVRRARIQRSWGILCRRWAGSSMAEQLTLNQLVGSSSLPRLTSTSSTTEPVRTAPLLRDPRSGVGLPTRRRRSEVGLAEHPLARRCHSPARAAAPFRRAGSLDSPAEATPSPAAGPLARSPRPLPSPDSRPYSLWSAPGGAKHSILRSR